MNVKSLLRQFLNEDIGKGDITSNLVTNRKISARIISRDDGVVAGADYAGQIFALRGCNTKIHKKDGQRIRKGEAVMTVTGPARGVLSCERTALNLLSRMSGIATATSLLVKKIKAANKGTELYSTRKTAPGLRYFDKEAVEIGGGRKHRLTLSDMIMIKDNHIAVEGAILPLIQKARRKSGTFEVEVETESDALLAAAMGASIIMLDNFTPARVRRAVNALKKIGLRNKVKLEASGGITLENVADYAKAGVDMISVGGITNSAKAIDYSLEV